MHPTTRNDTRDRLVRTRQFTPARRSACTNQVAAEREVDHQRRHPLDAEEDVTRLVADARHGSELAWEELVRRYDGSLRQLARSYRLGHSDIDDVVQTTWIQLFRRLDRLRDGAAVHAWLITTTRRECLRSFQRNPHEVLTDGTDHEHPDDCDPPAEVIAREQRAVLARALGILPQRHRRLIELLINDECSSYEEVSTRLGMPMGSIGPTRARSLARLGLHAELRAFQI
jgi:RNA polymerase sigma factor (sigma-70 family)